MDESCKSLSIFSPSAVPKKLLQDSITDRPVYPPAPPPAHDPNVVGDSAPPDGSTPVTADTVPGKKKRGREIDSASEKERSEPEGVEERPLWPLEMNATALNSKMGLISNGLAAYTFIAAHPERTALFFMCGVCLGLFLTLFTLVVQISCRMDCKPSRGQGQRQRRPAPKHQRRPADSDSDTSDSDDSDWDTGSDLSARRRRRFERTLNTNVFTSAEELERAQRLEERERIIREIWMNGQPDVPGTRSLNRYY
uniref:EVA1 domain-containing protein n=2 Tax=Denticeps clupeoides TaxID=299321 RepID=A0AAY4CLG0_9TELE